MIAATSVRKPPIRNSGVYPLSDIAKPPRIGENAAATARHCGILAKGGSPIFRRRQILRQVYLPQEKTNFRDLRLEVQLRK